MKYGAQAGDWTWARKRKDRGRPGEHRSESMSLGAGKKLRIFISHMKFSALMHCYIIFSILQQSSMQWKYEKWETSIWVINFYS